MSFTHLHVHTEFSLLDGSCKIRELVERAKELGMDSLSITDHGVMYGVIDFYRAAKEIGINPILGCEVYVAPNSRFDRETGRMDERYHHLVLLAENNIGYTNLIKIVSKGFLEGFYYKPRVDYEVLSQYHEGIIALSACLAGTVATRLRSGFYEEAKVEAQKLHDIFGPGYFYLELQDHGIPDQRTVNQGLIRISKETKIPLVATNDVHYIKEEDAKAHDILLCIQTQKKVSDENRMRYEGGQYYLKSEEEMDALFPYAREALDNTYAIGKRCHVEIEFGEYKLPKFDVPKEYEAFEYLSFLCVEGLKKRYPNEYNSLTERLHYELNTIRDMGFVDYFLIVYDFIKYARDNRIPVGPGRGSAAGSLVAYSLEITNIDPIKFNLLFERFLNPERLTMPDIDIDFCYEKRQKVIDYVVQKYGKERVVQIVTFGTMAAKAVIRDVGRALDLPYSYVDTVAKMIPLELGITIEKALKGSRDFKELYDTDEQAKYLIDMSLRLEGLPRHTSTHAAGVVISKEDVVEYVPLSRGADESITTQFTMTTLEELGLLKVDFLGLRTLTVIQDAQDLICANGRNLDIDTIDIADKKVYELIASGRTEGIFQLESAGMKSFMKELKPESIEDIIAGLSLYRPGPMDFIPKYVKGKNNKDSISYDCKELVSILTPTYGCIVYQEQVMQIVRDLAGYSYGRSDLVRRAMSKKKASVMEKERKNFVYGNAEEGVKGCIANGLSEAVANKIFDDMTDFAKYAFNKSHAAAYAVVSYQTAYLKYYYPVEFMAALLTSVLGNNGKIAEYTLNLRQMGIMILPPDINEGYGSFSVSDGNIRYGLSAIKGLGKSVIDAIVSERENNGRFTSLKDFTMRLSGKEVNKRTVENFIKAGAFDTLQGTRKQKMSIYAGVIDGVNQERKTSLTGQMSLFDFVEPDKKAEFEVKYPDIGEYDKEDLLAFEKEVLGIYVSGHPMDEYEQMWRKNITKTTADFILDEETKEVRVTDGEEVVIGGIITLKSVKVTRTNTTMAFVTVEDLFGTVEVIVFSRDYNKYKQMLTEDNKVFIKGRVNAEEDKPAKIVCQSVIPFTKVPRELWLKFNNKQDFVKSEQKLYELLSEFDGEDGVCIYLECEKQIKRLPKNRNIKADKNVLAKLNEKMPSLNVLIQEKSIEKA